MIYVDMVEVFDLLKLKFFESDGRERTALSEMCKKAIVRLLSSTVLKKLSDDERSPAEKVLLLELPKADGFESGVDQLPYQIDAALKTLRLLPKDKLEEKLNVSGENTHITAADILDGTKIGVKPDLFAVYKESIQLLVDSVCMDHVHFERACADLCNQIEDLYKKDCIHRG